MSTSNAMIYIEFIEREPLVAKEIFRALCSQRAWHDRRDRQLGMLGRTHAAWSRTNLYVVRRVR